jgi:hypothetical protein
LRPGFHPRLFRQGKASISAELMGIFERLSAQNWQNGMEKLRDGRLLGRFFAKTRAKLREIAERLGMRRPSTWRAILSDDERANHIELPPTNRIAVA